MNDILDNDIEVARRERDDMQGVPAVPVQRVQTSYTTAVAVQQPRSLHAVTSRALDEARLMGAYGYYAWGAGKDRIEGPSKDLAMAMMRCFGNCAIEMDAVQDMPDAWIFTAKFIDLETGFTLPRQFRQSKEWKVYGKFDQARKEDIRFQIGQSKAVRNVILNAVPKWLINKAMDACKGGVREKIEKNIKSKGHETVVNRAMERLEKLGASEERVLAAMGRRSRKAIDVEDLVLLFGNIAALETESDTVEAVFPIPDADKQPGSGGVTNRLTGGSKQEDTKPDIQEEQAEAADTEDAAEPDTQEEATDEDAGPTAREQVEIRVSEIHDGDESKAERELFTMCKAQFDKTPSKMNKGDWETLLKTLKKTTA
jgi:hypothetical protein